MVMPTRIQCEYQVPVVGQQSQAAIEALVKGARIDFDLLEKLGLVLTSDATTLAATVVHRTLIASFVPTSPAAGSASFVPGDGTPGSGTAVDHLTLSAPGAGYGGPPVVEFELDEASEGPSGTENVLLPSMGPLIAKAHAEMGVDAVHVLQGGTGYTGATAAKFVGGQLAPGGVQATAGAITIVANVITAIAVATPGGPYNVPPRLVITDTGGGTGAVASSSLLVNRLVLDSPGRDIALSGDLVFVPPFFGMAPAAGSQVAALRGWMTAILARAARSPVIPIDPILLP